MSIRVYLLNDDYITVRVLPGTTIKELSHKIASLLDIKEKEAWFSLFETNQYGRIQSQTSDNDKHDGYDYVL